MNHPETNPEKTALEVMPGVAVDKDRVVAPRHRRPALTEEAAVAGVMSGDRAILGRVLSLMESTQPQQRELAHRVLERLIPFSGNARRIGITGVPGAGKSTFIECFGLRLTEQGKRVAVLPVDPSSQISGGSILGDKTRMENLSRHELAMVRPTASGTWQGGIARSTRMAMLVLEAAGFDVIIVETVGVGQGEMEAAYLVDFFLLLALAGAGDELQGIKRGILEMADAVAINKADGDNLLNSRVARSQLEGSLSILRNKMDAWRPPVLLCSALEGSGLGEIISMMDGYFDSQQESGNLAARRREQDVYWFDQSLMQQLRDRLMGQPGVEEKLAAARQSVAVGNALSFKAAEELVDSILPSI